ncbi:MAG: hypothetical protein ACPL7B_17880, partial [Candidatus Poribacteria bacterium]
AITFGLCYKFNEKILSVCDIIILSNDDLTFESHLGWEYNVKNWLILRFGLSNKKPTAGIGIKISRIDLDYAMVDRLSFLSAQVKL